MSAVDKAPERIWLDLPSFNGAVGFAHPERHRKDGWPEYIRADLAAPSAPEVHPSLALESSEMPYRIFTDSSRIWMDDSDGGSLFAYVREGAPPSAPAEVEGLVEKLNAGVRMEGLHDDNSTELFDVEEANETMFEAATSLTALQADNERLRARVQELGGEGHAYRKGQLAGYEVAKARAEKAEAERDAWKDNAETLAEAVSPFADVGVPSDPMSRINLTADREFVIAARETLAAHAKLKGEV